MRYSRHIAHEIRAKVRRQNDDTVAGSDKASREIVQPSSHVQHSALLAIRSVSKVLETTYKLSGTLCHDNFVLFQRRRRKCSIPWFALMHVYHGVALSKQRRSPRPSIPSWSSQMGKFVSIEKDLYARGPLGRPPWPSTGWIREASRIDSSLGPGSR